MHQQQNIPENQGSYIWRFKLLLKANDQVKKTYKCQNNRAVKGLGQGLPLPYPHICEPGLGPRAKLKPSAGLH